MNDYLFNAGLHFVTVYLSLAISMGIGGWAIRKVIKLGLETFKKEGPDPEYAHRVDQGIKKFSWLLVVITIVWGAYSSLTHGGITYKHNDVEDPVGDVKKMVEYRETMRRDAEAVITLDGALQPESSESRAKRMEEKLDWKSRLQQEEETTPQE